MRVPIVPLAAVVAVAALLSSAASASALDVGRITAKSSPTMVRYHVSICEKRSAQVRLGFAFRAVDQPSGTFRDSAFYRAFFGCGVYRGHFPNNFAVGLWRLTITISDSHGSVRRRSVRIFLPPPTRHTSTSRS